MTAIPFGLLFGVVARDAGLDMSAIMGMSTLVIAGASQYAAIAQMQDNAPAIFVVLTGLAVNLRMAIYSASLAPHLGQALSGAVRWSLTCCLTTHSRLP